MGGYLAPVPFFFYAKHKSDYFLGIEKTAFFLQIFTQICCWKLHDQNIYFCIFHVIFLSPDASLIGDYSTEHRQSVCVSAPNWFPDDNLFLWNRRIMKKNKTALPKELIIICIYLWNMSTKVWNHHYFKSFI